MHPVHKHLNLLGWVSIRLFGLIYCQFPQLANNGLAKAHLWIYNLALPIQMATLYIYLGGNADIEPVLGMASMAVGFFSITFCGEWFKEFEITKKFRAKRKAPCGAFFYFVFKLFSNNS